MLNDGIIQLFGVNHDRALPMELGFRAGGLVQYHQINIDNAILRGAVNDEYENTTWYLNNKAGTPMVAVNYTKLLPHGLYPEYGIMAWNFMKRYSRDLENGKVRYRH